MLSRAPCTRYSGFEASEPIQFPRPDSIFSNGWAPFSGRLRLAVRPSRPRSRRAKLGSFGRRMEPARPKSRFLPRFVSFQGFARRKISHRSQRPSPVRATGNDDAPRRLRAQRSLASPHVRAPSRQAPSPRSERRRRGSRAGSGTRESNRGQSRDRSTDLFFQKAFPPLGHGHSPSLRTALATKQSRGRLLWPWIASLRSQ
jgi:hypothetical protein